MATKPSKPEVPPTERVQASYKQLSLESISLNEASDELGVAISTVESSLQKLNLGISAWVTLSAGGDEDFWWSRGIGYTKIRDKWGIALKTSSGRLSFPEDDSEEVWFFSDAPRWMRTEAVAKIPDLLEALLKQAQETSKAIKKKTVQVHEFAAAISAVAVAHEPTKQKDGR